MKQYKFGADFLHPEFKSFVYHFQPDHTRTATNTVPTNTNVNANGASAPHRLRRPVITL